MPNDFYNKHKSVPNIFFFWQGDKNVPNTFGTKMETEPKTFDTATKTVLFNFGTVNKNCVKYTFGTGDELVLNTHLA